MLPAFNWLSPKFCFITFISLIAFLQWCSCSAISKIWDFMLTSLCDIITRQDNCCREFCIPGRCINEDINFQPPLHRSEGNAAACCPPGRSHLGKKINKRILIILGTLMLVSQEAPSSKLMSFHVYTKIIMEEEKIRALWASISHFKECIHVLWG